MQRKELSDTPINVTVQKKTEKIIKDLRNIRKPYPRVSFQEITKKTLIILTLKWVRKLRILSRWNSNFIPPAVYLHSLLRHLKNRSNLWEEF